MFSQQIENLNDVINTYKLNLIKKEKEMNQLKEKEIFLNRKIMGLEKRKNLNMSNSIDDKSNIISLMGRFSQDSSGEKYKRYPIKIIKRTKNSSFNLKSISSNSKIINKKHKQNINILANINSNNNGFNTYELKKNSLLDFDKSNKTSIDKNIKINLNNSIEKSEKNISRNNIEKNVNLNISKLQTNIKNNYYNIEKNSLLINLNNIILEKEKLKRKLDSYLKMINSKINNLKNKNEKKNYLHKKSEIIIMRHRIKVGKVGSFTPEKQNVEIEQLENREMDEEVEEIFEENSEFNNDDEAIAAMEYYDSPDEIQ